MMMIEEGNLSNSEKFKQILMLNERIINDKGRKKSPVKARKSKRIANQHLSRLNGALPDDKLT